MANIIREYKQGNATVTETKCELCGGIHFHKSFMVSDGHDDADWDELDYCTNVDCPSNQFKPPQTLSIKAEEKEKTMSVKIEEIDYKIEEGNLIVEAEIKPKFGEIVLRGYILDEDEEQEGKKQIFNVTLDKSQDLHDLAVIISKVVELNETQQ